MNIKQALQQASNLITESDSAQLDAELLLLHVIQAQRIILFTDPDRELSQEEQSQFDGLVERRINGEPVAYLLGQQGFWTLDLKVAPSTLIPRGDTESLVEWVLENHDDAQKKVLDLGTGTGAIALALASERNQWNVSGLDLMKAAVQLAKENAKLNGIKNAEFYQSSWFENVPTDSQFDLIVSNPPYIDEQDEHLAQGDVRFEPLSALVAKENGLADLRKIAEDARQYLNGYLVMEHGWQQAKDVQRILLELGYEKVGSGQDLGNRDRFTFGFYQN